MSFAAIAALADNQLDYQEERPFAAILGGSPSKGARSPVLWNAAFEAQGIDARMLPIDVPPERLIGLLDSLDADQRFLGGAVAVPHKEEVARWLGERLTPEAKAIGAVNCLFRDAADRLMGTNTDGEGALVSFEARFGSLQGKTVLLTGLGGAGKAVAAFVHGAVVPGGQLMVSGRSERAREYANRLGYDWVNWYDLARALPAADVLLNCTSVGSGTSAGESPFSEELLALLPDYAVVFDIIYQPAPSALLSLAAKRGLSVLGGTAMNLEQAVLAFSHSVREPKGSGVTRAAMEEAKWKAG